METGYAAVGLIGLSKRANHMPILQHGVFEADFFKKSAIE